jgi:hypothetical protein
MRTDFALFRERPAEACRARNGELDNFHVKYGKNSGCPIFWNFQILPDNQPIREEQNGSNFSSAIKWIRKRGPWAT